MNRPQHLLGPVLVCLVAAVPACRTGTGPPAGGTHPEGVMVGTEAVSGRPFGAAVTRKGVALVTRLDAESLARFDLADAALTGGARVGSVPTFVAVNAAGTRAYVTNQYGGYVGVVDLATNREIDTIPIVGDPFAVTLSPDERVLYVSSNVDSLYAIDLATRGRLAAVWTPQKATSIVFHPRDAVLYASTRAGGTVIELSARTHAILRTFTLGGLTQEMAVSPDGIELYVANQSGWLNVVDLRAGHADSIPLEGGAVHLALTPDAAQLYVGLWSAGRLLILDRASRSLVKRLITGGVPRQIAFDRSGRAAVVANEAGWVSFIR